ncbi:MAG: S8 family serine peptidase [Candidatus Babeliales bacterium]
MKRKIFSFFIGMPIFLHGIFPRDITQTPASPHRLIISVPEDKSLDAVAYNAWIAAIEKARTQFEKQLANQYHIISGPLLSLDERKNSLYFIHKPHHFKEFNRHEVSPHMVLHIPESIPFSTDAQKDAVITQLYRFLDNKNFLIRPDHAVILSNAFYELAMESFTLEELNKIKSKRLLPELEKKLYKFKEIKKPTDKDRQELKALTDRIEVIKQAEQILFWYQSIPVVGMRDVADPTYPFLPHYFSLWELAPRKGKGIKVGLVDTGVAAFQVSRQKEYRKNIDLRMVADFVRDTFNVIGNDDIDPLEYLIHQLEDYIDKKKFNFEFLMNTMPLWIKHYLINKGDQELRNYIIQNGKKNMVRNGILTAQGEAIFAKILQNINKEFHLVWLEEPIREQVVIELLPLAPISDQETTFVSGHGSHTFGLIGGKLQGNQYATTPQYDEGICGMAPHADLLMIKAFDQEGNSARSTLAEGIKRAKAYGVDVLNLSLKVSDTVHSSDEDMGLIDNLLSLIPYVVAASGNDGDQKSKNYPGRVESYPARLASVEFDVGAFGMQGNKPYAISHFSQYELLVGPKIVAPGYNILSCGLVPGQKTDSEYVFMHGTSMAAPLISGFMALVLGEFKDHFSKRQILDVCYASVVRLYDSKEWKDKALLGTIDMRTALFTLHVLKRCKEILKGSHRGYNFDANFEMLVTGIRTLLYYNSDEYGKKYLNGLTLQLASIPFIQAAGTHKEAFLKEEYFAPGGWNRLHNAIDYCASGILQSIDAQHASELPQALRNELAGLMHKEINIFGYLPSRVQQRLRESPVGPKNNQDTVIRRKKT